MRFERDRLGEKNIEDSVFSGIHTARAKENFKISDYRNDSEFIKAMAIVKYACALTNQQLGYLDENIGIAIQSACKKIFQGEYSEQFTLDVFQGGAGTSTNMNFNEVIANIALKELGRDKGEYSIVNPLKHVNMHQSTNDVYPTALKIAILKKLKKLEIEISYLQEEFQKKEKEFQNIVKIGRTQLQDAVPMTLGMEFGAFSEAISRDRWRIFKSRERIKIINIGGTAIGTGLGAPKKYIFKVTENLRNLTGLNIARGENLVDSTQNWDSFVEISGMLKALASNLFKISSDLRLLSSGPTGGLGEINLPAVQTGSTIMPTKINPVIPEAVSQVALRIFSNDNMLNMAVTLGQLELNQFAPLINFAISESLELLINSIKIFRSKCIVGITANISTCKSYLYKSYSIATALVPILGYDKVEEIILKSSKTGISVVELIEIENILPKKEIEKILSPERMYKLGYDDNDI